MRGNTIERANRFGINSYARQSTIEENVIRDIALIANLGQAGMGCETDQGGGQCTEDGDGLRIKVDQDGAYSGNLVTVQYNRIENTGYNGIDVFGYQNTFYRNVILLPCASKGDCGGLRSFGGDDFGSTVVHDLTISENIIVDALGNTDGAHPDFEALFGFGLYIDHHSRDVTSSGNIIIRSTAAGLLYQDSTGSMQNNTLFDNVNQGAWGYQVNIAGSPSQVTNFSGNVLLARLSTAGTLYAGQSGQLAASDHNGFYHANRNAHINVEGDKDLAAWQAASGKDANSDEWVDAVIGEAEIFYNDNRSTQIIPLTRPYIDLSSSPVGSNLTLEPFTAQILIPNGDPLPVLAISKQAPTAGSAGQPFSYTLSVSNQGGSSASSLTIQDALPAGTQYASGGELVGGNVEWRLDSLAPGEVITLTFTVTPTGGANPIINQNYHVQAAGGYQASGAPVYTYLDARQVYLPLVQR